MSEHTKLLDTCGRHNRKLEDKKCAACGSLYRPARSVSRYCSRHCAWSKNGGKNRKTESWWVNNQGYIEGRIWNGDKQRRVKAHRYTIELHIGRRLQPKEDVHHINGVKTDNRISNLQLLSHGDHSSLTNSGRDYRRGYKLNLSIAERKKRADRMRIVQRAAIAKARGKSVSLVTSEGKSESERSEA